MRYWVPKPFLRMADKLLFRFATQNFIPPPGLWWEFFSFLNAKQMQWDLILNAIN
jgi:hypothetical protein